MMKCDVRRNDVEKDVKLNLMAENLNCFHSPDIELYRKEPTECSVLFLFLFFIYFFYVLNDYLCIVCMDNIVFEIQLHHF